MRKLSWLFLTLWLGLGSVSAIGEELAFDDPALNARYYSLLREIRCPLCLNESIAESKSDVASDLRREVMRMIGEGASDDEIRTALAARYGEFILYNPRLSQRTLALWAGPFLFLAVGALVFWRVLAKRRGQPLDEDPAL